MSRVLSHRVLTRAGRCAALALVVAAGIELVGILPPYELPVSIPGLI